MKKITFNSFIMAISLLVTISIAIAGSPRREVSVLTQDGWAKASVSPMTAWLLEKRRSLGKDSALIHVNGKRWREGQAAYLFIHYPLPVAGTDVPRLTRRSIREYLLPVEFVRIEFQQPSDPRMIEI